LSRESWSVVAKPLSSDRAARYTVREQIARGATNTRRSMTMAKKASKKSKAPAKKAPAKEAAKKSGAKSAAKGDPLAPVGVNTGKGASPLDIGRDLVAHFNAGKNDADLWAKHFNMKALESIEGHGTNMKWVGGKAVKAKNEWWMSDHVVHGARAEGPFVGSTGFAVRFTMDVETKSSGERVTMNEVGVYTVANGKIIREEFMYGM